MDQNYNQHNLDIKTYNLPPNHEESSFWTKFKENFTELIEFTAIMGAILLTIHFFVAEPHKVSGSSMEPNFHDGDYIITDKISKRFTQHQRGEVVILKNPRNTDQVFIKRIIGMPGEKVSILEGKVYINGLLLSEPYLEPSLVTPGGMYLKEGDEISVPPGYYFVMGDNRKASSDSRDWGPLDQNLIVGYPWLRYWPLDRINIIKINTPSE